MNKAIISQYKLKVIEINGDEFKNVSLVDYLDEICCT